MTSEMIKATIEELDKQINLLDDFSYKNDKEIRQAKKLLKDVEVKKEEAKNLSRIKDFIRANCKHEWEYMGSDHRDITYKCKICGEWKTR